MLPDTVVAQTAWYVAGHAVMRAVIGYPFRSVTVEPQQLEEGLIVVGGVDAFIDVTARTKEFGPSWVTFERIIMALAGWTALVTMEGAGPVTGETALGRDHVAFMIDEQLVLRNVQVLADLHEYGDASDIYAISTDTARGILRLLSIRAAIGAVAQALRDHRTLEGHEAIAVMITVIGEADVHHARQMISDSFAAVSRSHATEEGG